MVPWDVLNDFKTKKITLKQILSKIVDLKIDPKIEDT